MRRTDVAEGRPARQRGASLLEALLAFLVLSLAMAGMARLQSHLRSAADLARQRSEAVRLAHEDIEALRGFATLSPAAGTAAYADIASTSAVLLPPQGAQASTRFRIERSVASSTAPRIKTASVSVSWDDRRGSAQQLVLTSVLAGADPALSGALALAPSGRPVHGAFARSAQIPLAAKDLGDGRSVFKPALEGSVAWVFDNRSGRIEARCSGIAAAALTRDLGTADVAACDAVDGLLLSGQVRFSNASPPDPANANEAPLQVAVSVAGTPFAAAPECTSEAQKLVSYSAGTGVRREAVPLAATPAWLGLGGWSEVGERFTAYHCLLRPAGTPLRWSGRSTLVPQGWSLGSAAAQFKVCRYSADQDASGAVDHNGEHPDRYTDVVAALPQQNFLVVKGDQACPTAAALKLSGSGGLVFSSLGTVLHQP